MEKRYECHVPTEQYGFITVHTDGTAEQAIEAYREVADLMRLPKYGAGMEKKKYEEIIEHMIEKTPNQIDPGELDEMNSIQRFGFDLVRLCKQRIAYKNR